MVLILIVGSVSCSCGDQPIATKSKTTAGIKATLTPTKTVIPISIKQSTGVDVILQEYLDWNNRTLTVYATCQSEKEFTPIDALIAASYYGSGPDGIKFAMETGSIMLDWHNQGEFTSKMPKGFKAGCAYEIEIIIKGGARIKKKVQI
jgi:hypothetical protein